MSLRISLLPSTNWSLTMPTVRNSVRKPRKCSTANAATLTVFRHQRRRFSKDLCSRSSGKEFVHNQASHCPQFNRTREPFFGRFCRLFSLREPIISPRRDESTDKDSEQTDDRRYNAGPHAEQNFLTLSGVRFASPYTASQRSRARLTMHPMYPSGACSVLPPTSTLHMRDPQSAILRPPSRTAESKCPRWRVSSQKVTQ